MLPISTNRWRHRRNTISSTIVTPMIVVGVHPEPSRSIRSATVVSHEVRSPTICSRIAVSVRSAKRSTSGKMSAAGIQTSSTMVRNSRRYPLRPMLRGSGRSHAGRAPAPATAVDGGRQARHDRVRPRGAFREIHRGPIGHRNAGLSQPPGCCCCRRGAGSHLRVQCSQVSGGECRGDLVHDVHEAGTPPR